MSCDCPKQHCTHCSASVQICAMYDHLSHICTENIVKCPFDCSKELCRKNIGSHLEICDKNIIRCNYCSEFLPRNSLRQHWLIYHMNHECGNLFFVWKSEQHQQPLGNSENFVNLPNEVWYLICVKIDSTSLVSLSLVNTQLNHTIKYSPELSTLCATFKTLPKPTCPICNKQFIFLNWEKHVLHCSGSKGTVHHNGYMVYCVLCNTSVSRHQAEDHVKQHANEYVRPIFGEGRMHFHIDEIRTMIQFL